MMAKDSVKNRMESGSGISFTEFSYQLVQGYDFLWLFGNRNCKMQMGGSDQWGNILTGTELIRRKLGGDAYALTCPLITKSDGGKFGKTEEGNVWLDPERTSPYRFYQFWLNTSDTDAEDYIRKFTLFPEDEVARLIADHHAAPHLRVLQKALAKDITIRVHSEQDYNAALEASEILFGKGTTETLKKLSEKTFLAVFEGVPQFIVSGKDLAAGINIIDFLSEKTAVFPSKSEARRSVKEGGVALNKEKVGESFIVNDSSLLNDKYILVQKGKKNYFLITVIS
jgi:tyrosyl-tRNA synthetase